MLTGYWLWVLLDHRLQFTHRQVTLQTASVAEHASTVFRAVDAALLATVTDLNRGRVDPATAHSTLRLRMGSNGYVVALSLTDAHGRVLASSWSDPAPIARTSAPHGTTGELRVGMPTRNPFDGREAIELARTLPGEPGGVAQVIATVDHGFVTGFFTHVAYAKDSQVGLFALDGTRLAGSIDLAALAPRASPTTVLNQLLAGGADASTEHDQVFASAQRLPGLPMVAVTLRDRAAVLAPWYEYLVSAGIATVAALVLLTLVVRRLQREMRARVQVQAALERSREEARFAFEASQQRTRRLESLGRLAGGIAHDFNNILAAILGFGDLLQQEVAGDSAVARHLDQMLRAGERGRSLVARILTFSRGGARAAVPVAVDSVVAEALDLMAATAPANVSIERELAAADALILGDATQLFELLNNLCANALHAMPDGGALTIRTATLRTLGVRALSHGSLAVGAHATVAVIDTGLGMSSDTLEHLFEPFFTTRASSGGTGLGLAMVHGAIREMNGAIDVQSTPGAGSRFTLYFPLAETATSIEPAPAASAPRGCGQVVMVVDDEPALVSLTEELLAGLGYEPVGFRDPQQALAVLRQAPARFDALLTDQVMPGLVGTELARQWHALRPDAPILLASGFGGPDLERQARDAGVTRLLQKPLHRGELAVELARVLAPH